MSTRRLAQSVEGLNSSLALAAGDLWPKNVRPIAVIKGLSVSFFGVVNWYINAEMSQMQSASRTVIHHGIHS